MAGDQVEYNPNSHTLLHQGIPGNDKVILIPHRANVLWIEQYWDGHNPERPFEGYIYDEPYFLSDRRFRYQDGSSLHYAENINGSGYDGQYAHPNRPLYSNYYTVRRYGMEKRSEYFDWINNNNPIARFIANDERDYLVAGDTFLLPETCFRAFIGKPAEPNPDPDPEPVSVGHFFCIA